ncbi:sensor histidine kinase [Glycomyces rhizosphaerae]|uniref:histidine kinase n=1 Tax=Glycomyces rhizosphaerae TaxID=2054422 RepID=A0ABV7Q009_9ACTN
MRGAKLWASKVWTGFARSCAVAGTGLLIPAGWAAVAVVVLWFGLSPWESIAPFLIACAATLALSKPVAGRFRRFAERRAGSVIRSGERERHPIVQMSTGYWWNGYSYTSTQKEAREDQELKDRFRDPATWRDLRFTVVAAGAGAIAAVPPAGLVAAVLGFAQPDADMALVVEFAPSSASMRLIGVLGLVIALAAAPFAWRPAVPLTVRFLGRSQATALAERVDELTAQRADSTVAQAAEIRRIERDLHDGAQARLVALGLALATAEKLMETDPAGAKALMREARAGAAASLVELRELVRGISPPVLNERGLVDAVRALALDSSIEVAVSADLRMRLDAPIEAALYFGIAELITNAVKHARATRARIDIALIGSDLVVEVEDDGRGRAEAVPDGGLAGLRRRLGVFDGKLELDSPVGGPTRAKMTVPCESL